MKKKPGERWRLATGMLGFNPTHHSLCGGRGDRVADGANRGSDDYRNHSIASSIRRSPLSEQNDPRNVHPDDAARVCSGQVERLHYLAEWLSWHDICVFLLMRIKEKFAP
jgi:hypothetical protein